MKIKSIVRMRVAAAAISLAVLVGAGSLPASQAASTAGQFQVRCFTDHLAQVDPIVAPGVEPTAHMHEFFGNSTTNKDSTYSSMVHQATSCSTPLDSAGYWTPTLIAPDGSTIRAKAIKVYYRGTQTGPSQAFPADLRMVSHSIDKISGDHIIILFPQCWDGVHLDSPDHISHMFAVPKARVCPSAFPVRVPFLTIVVDYPVSDLPGGYTLSSGDLSTAHADFWNTWDQAGLEALVARCVNSTTNCGRIDG